LAGIKQARWELFQESLAYKLQPPLSLDKIEKACFWFFQESPTMKTTTCGITACAEDKQSQIASRPKTGDGSLQGAVHKGLEIAFGVGDLRLQPGEVVERGLSCGRKR
jgi:hypothetical protein